jgi:DnaJ-class molecular chaperone
MSEYLSGTEIEVVGLDDKIFNLTVPQCFDFTKPLAMRKQGCYNVKVKERDNLLIYVEIIPTDFTEYEKSQFKQIIDNERE